MDVNVTPNPVVVHIKLSCGKSGFVLRRDVSDPVVLGDLFSLVFRIRHVGLRTLVEV